MTSTIKGITVQIGGDTVNLNKALKGVDTTSKNLQRELNLVNKELKFNPDNAVLLAQKQEILTDKINATREKLQKLNEVQEQVERQAKSGDLGADEYRAYQREVESTKSKLEHLESELGKTNDKFSEVQRKSGEITFSNAENKIDNLKGKFKDLSDDAIKKMDEVSKKATAIGDGIEKVSAPLNIASGAAAAGIGAGIKFASDFEDAIAKVNTIADTSQKPIEDLRKEILELSNETGVDSVTIAQNVYDAISAGQDTANAVNFVRNSVALSKAGFADAGAALDVLTTIMNAYGMESKEVNSVSDMLIQTQNLGKVTVGELASSMGKVIPTAKSYGVQLDQLAAAYSITTAKGIASAESTTYINSMLNELGKSGTKSSNALKELSGKSFTELMNEGASLSDVLAILKESADKQNKSLGDMFGSAEAAKAATTLLGDSASTFNDRLKEMNGATGATDTALKKLETSSSKTKKMLNELKNDGIELGAEALKELQPLLNDGKNAIKGITEWIKKLNPQQKQALIHALEIVAVLGPGVTLLGKTFKGVGNIAGVIPKAVKVIKSLTTTTRAAEAAQIGLNVAQDSNPIGAVIVAITALVGVIGLLVVATSQERDSIYRLNDVQKEAADNTTELKLAYDNYRDSKEKALSDTKGEFKYYQDLWNELHSIVDENGKVKEGYEDRAKFITNELGKVTGEEIKWNDKTIKSYDDLRSSIEKTLKIKEAETTLSGLKGNYDEARSNVDNKRAEAAEQWNAYLQTYKDIYGKGGLKEQLEKAENELKTYKERLSKADKGSPTERSLQQHVNEAKMRVEDLYKKLYVGDKDNKSAMQMLSAFESAYYTAIDHVSDYERTVENYEGLSTAVIKGDVDEIGKALEKSQTDFITAKNGSERTLRQQKDKYKEHYEQMQKAVKTGAEGISNEQLKEAKVLYEKSLKEYEEFQKKNPPKTINQILEEETKKEDEEKTQGKLKAVIENYESLKAEFENGVPGITEKMVNNARAVMNKYLAEMGDKLPSDLKYIAQKNTKMATEGLDLGMKEMPIKASAKSKEVASAIRNENANFYNAGEGLGSNAAEGFSSKLSAAEVMDKVKTGVFKIGNALKEAFRTVLDMHSPSRVTGNFGENAGFSFAGGIGRTFKTVKKTIKRLRGIVDDTLGEESYEAQINFNAASTSNLSSYRNGLSNTLNSLNKLKNSGIAQKSASVNNINNSSSRNINGGINVTINNAKLDTDADIERFSEQLADTIIRKGMEWG